VGAAVAELDPSLIVDVRRGSQRSGNGLRLELRLPTLLEMRRQDHEAKEERTSSDVH
jgi:hypothetical protein